MKAVQVATLTGLALNWAVQDLEFGRLTCSGEGVKGWVKEDHERGVGASGDYANDWLWAGPIIEREGISVVTSQQGYIATDSYLAISGKDDRIMCTGSTFLEAAMRVYVMSVIGAEIAIPDHLAPD